MVTVMQKRCLSPIIIVIICAVLCACSPELGRPTPGRGLPTPTVTAPSTDAEGETALAPTPMPTSALELSPVPTLGASSLAAQAALTRTWETGPVLLTFRTLFENSAPYGVSRIPDLILYADGRLIVRREGEIQAAHLSRREICALLNTVDAIGLFDFDIASYNAKLETLPLGMVSTSIIEVNAWRQQRVVAEALRELLDDPDVQVPYPLRATYQVLSDYQPGDVHPYQAKQLALTIHQCAPDAPCLAENTWSLNAQPLRVLYESAKKTNVKNRASGFGLLLERATATDVEQAGVQPSVRGFSEDGVHYIVSARPLLPYESLESAVAYEAEIPSPGIPTDTVSFTCYAADGMLPIPDQDKQGGP